MPVYSKIRLAVATVVSAVMIIGIIVVCILLWNADSLVYLASLLTACAVTGFLASLLWTWAYRDLYDELDPIDPAAGNRRR